MKLILELLKITCLVSLLYFASDTQSENHLLKQEQIEVSIANLDSASNDLRSAISLFFSSINS